MKHLTLLFLIKDDQILLAMKKRGFGAGRWNGVGGKVEPGETIKEALVRECREEIGVIPLVYEHVADLMFYQFDNGEYHEMKVHAYFCSKWGGEPVETEEMAPRWYAVGHIPYEEMWPDDKYWLPRTLAGEFITAEFHMNERDEITDSDISAGITN